MARRILALVLACVFAALAGCGTVAGLGKDIEAVGGGVSSGARR